jgi:hypothetical protein
MNKLQAKDKRRFMDVVRSQGIPNADELHTFVRVSAHKQNPLSIWRGLFPDEAARALTARTEEALAVRAAAAAAARPTGTANYAGP